ncbi:MAG: bactofilin family protein [Planctomycetaceae bacterium]
MPSNEGVISIIGPGMQVDGDCETQGTLRIEGSVKGAVRAGKAVVLGKDGRIEGDIFTQDAVIGGHVKGTVVAESRLELQATCVIEGEVRARRIKLDEGGRIDGRIQTGGAKGSGGANPTAASPRRSALSATTEPPEGQVSHSGTGGSNA